MAEPSNDECTKVLAEYLELFYCLGYRYKYYLAPNAILEWFGTRHIRGALPIHEFLMRKFQTSIQHVNFDKASFCGPIEKNDFQSTTKNLPSHGAELTNSRNKVTGITSLKLRAESDVESDTETNAVETIIEVDNTLPTNLIAQTSSCDLNESDDSIDDSAPSCKRIKYSTPPPTPFKYLRRLPTKRLKDDSSDDDSSSGEEDNEFKKRQNIQTTASNSSSEYTPLRYLEAIGKLRESQADGDYKEQLLRLRLSYRRNLKNQTIQFALIIYERHDQKYATIKRRIRQPDFTKCIVDQDSLVSTEDALECFDTQPAVILSTRDGEEHEIIATVSTPSSSEIATALEDAAFSIQPPVQRTPTKATPIPPGTPKRRPRSAIVGAMSGIASLALASSKKLSRTINGKAPKLNAARSLRL